VPAVGALNDTLVFVAMDKGAAKLLAVERLAITTKHDRIALPNTGRHAFLRVDRPID
jgi:hypothetical protein